jgi:BirA family biotin operon repressor/biotin-[acetyl-CoA-carboxylase] ligase
MNSLDIVKVRDSLPDLLLTRLDALEVFPQIDSTNKYLLAQPAPPPGRLRVALAEHQTAGRGRFDRSWYSTPGSGICLSISYSFSSRPHDFSSLTLAIGAGIAEALHDIDISGIGLKWPNDIVIGDGKVGGILTEVQPTRTAGVAVVVGIGLNVDFPPGEELTGIPNHIGRITDLSSCHEQLPERSMIAVTLIECVYETMQRFAIDGFAPFIDIWQQYDWLRGQHIRIKMSEELVPGVARGIDVYGRLILETETGRRRIVSGSVRFDAPTGSHL